MPNEDNLENALDILKNYIIGLSFSDKDGEQFDPEEAVYFLRKSLERNVTSDPSITNHIKFLIGKKLLALIIYVMFVLLKDMELMVNLLMVL